MAGDSSYTETEIKLYVPDLQAVIVALEQNGAKLVAPRVFERNVRYDTPARDLSGEKRVLRLRQDTRARLTYKEEPTATGTDGVVSRVEVEAEVSDFDAVALILSRLGYHPYMQYEKYRTTYTLDGAEIVLDEMPFGNFVEIEASAASIPPMLARLGLTEAKPLPQSYTALFDALRQAMSLPFSDLTFANFEGLQIPASFFDQL